MSRRWLPRSKRKGPFPCGSGPLPFPFPPSLLPPRDLALVATRTTGSLGGATPERRPAGTLWAYQVAAADVFCLSRWIRIVSDPVDDREVPWTIRAYIQNASWNVGLFAVEDQPNAVLPAVFDDGIPRPMPKIPGMRRPVSGQNAGPRVGLGRLGLHAEIWRMLQPKGRSGCDAGHMASPHVVEDDGDLRRQAEYVHHASC